MQRSGGESDPGWGEASRYAAHLDRGWDHFDRGALAAARRSAEEARRVRPDDPDALYLLGQIALAEGDPEGALDWFDRAFEAEPGYAAPVYAAAIVALYDLDDPPRALDYVEHALATETLAVLDALDLQIVAADAEIRLGRVSAAVGRLSEMPEAETFEAACRLVALRREHPDAPPPHPDEMPDPAVAEAAAALFYDADGDPHEDEEYEAACRRLLELGARLARTWLTLERPDASAHVARLLVHAHPDAADAWYALAEAHMAAREDESAIRASLRCAILDAAEPVPAFVPDADALRARVIEILASSRDGRVRGLVDRPVPVFVHVADRVPPELVLDGVDPRIVVLSFGPRLGDPPHEILGLGIYRTGLAFHAGNADHVDRTLREFLLDEVAHVLGLDDPERDALFEGIDDEDDPAGGGPSGRRYDA